MHHPETNAMRAQNRVRTLGLLAAIAGGAYLCFLMALPFLSALVWALALAVVCTPCQRWLEARVKHPNLAALLSVVAIALVVIGTATFVGQRLVQESVKGAELIVTKVESGEWRQALEAHPRLAPLADWMERQNLPTTVKTVATWMTTTGASFLKGSVVELVGLLLTFYLLFFFLRDRNPALQLIRSLAPLSEAELDRVFGRVGDTIYATIYGTLAVSAIQGLLGGLMFWWLGLPAPLLWGTMMALLAVVPVMGAFVIWIPAALFLVMDGNWGKALILTVWGAAVVGTADNLLRPALVGRRLQLHTILAFLSVVGGLIVFGASGLILGPVTLTVTTELLKVWQERTATKTAARGSAKRRNDRSPLLAPAESAAGP
jgi:predicted PurR-regulated permease PerM